MNASQRTSRPEFSVEERELARIFDQKYRRTGSLDAGPALRQRFGHYNPDDHYEAIVDRLVEPRTRWADIGCGRDIFPSNPGLARALSDRCALLFGIDPDDNVRENPYVHAFSQSTIEDCVTAHRFDLITLRMVAEHIVEPQLSLARIADLLAPGGKLVIYTPNKHSPMSRLAGMTPTGVHAPIKKLLWGSEERDTFPTFFRLNTRADLQHHASAIGLNEVHFQYLDDCRTFSGFRWLNWCELQLWEWLRARGSRYPENCLLGIYERV